MPFNWQTVVGPRLAQRMLFVNREIVVVHTPSHCKPSYKLNPAVKVSHIIQCQTYCLLFSQVLENNRAPDSALHGALDIECGDNSVRSAKVGRQVEERALGNAPYLKTAFVTSEHRKIVNYCK